MLRKKIYGIILSAGLSGRIRKFKPLANYKGKTFIHNIITKLNPVCSQIIVVTGFNSEKLKTEVNKTLSESKETEIIDKLKFTYNEQYEKGMFTSLQAGLTAAKDSDWVLYHFVDQPGLPENFYKEFVYKIDDRHNWNQPTYKKQKGHPILIKKELFGLILNAPYNAILRKISNNQMVKKKFWECGYEEIFQDIDTEEDYQKLDY